jgi:hypothetical protein
VPALAPLDPAISALTDEADPTQVVRIAIAAVFVDRIGGCREALRPRARRGRRAARPTRIRSVF